MDHKSITQRIMKHLDGLSELERQQDTDIMIDAIAERYDVPRNVVEKSIAEWSSGRKKVEDDE